MSLKCNGGSILNFEDVIFSKELNGFEDSDKIEILKKVEPTMLEILKEGRLYKDDVFSIIELDSYLISYRRVFFNSNLKYSSQLKEIAERIAVLNNQGKNYCTLEDALSHGP